MKHTEYITHPVELMNEHATLFQGYWNRLQDGQPDLYDAMQRCRRDAIEAQLEPLCGDDILKGNKGIKTATALGIDHWEGAYLKAMPLEYADRLAGQLNAIERCCAWPWSMLMSSSHLKFFVPASRKKLS